MHFCCHAAAQLQAAPERHQRLERRRPAPALSTCKHAECISAVPLQIQGMAFDSTHARCEASVLTLALCCAMADSTSKCTDPVNVSLQLQAAHSSCCSTRGAWHGSSYAHSACAL